MDKSMPFAVLADLLNSHITEILLKERDNLDTIRLYRIGTYMAAFDQSAYALCGIFSAAEIYPMQLKDIPYPVVMACVSDTRLGVLRRNCKVLEDTSEHAAFTVPAMSMAEYHRWYKRHVSIFAD